MTVRVSALGIIVLVGLAWSGASVHAQATRAAAIEAAQAEKAQAIRPYTPTTMERVIDQIESGAWLDPAVTHGFYPTFESVLAGGGFTGGLGWRHFTGFASHVDLRASYSTLGYKAFEASATSPKNFAGRLDASVRAGWREVTQVGYFGLGTGTDVDDRGNFGLQTGYAEGRVTWRPVRRMFATGAVAYETHRERAGRGRAPSIETAFDADTAPNLGASPTYMRAHLDAGLNWLASPGYSRRGGLIRYGHDHYFPVAGTSGGTFGMGHAEIVQHLPLLRETWVLSLRARGESVSSNKDAAPYFMLPSLGSATTLRAYEPFRFRDIHSALFTAEWRWTPNRTALDLAFFADAGTTSSRFRGLSANAMKTDVGLGIRLHTPSTTVLRLDMARGSEGWRFVLTNSAPF